MAEAEPASPGDRGAASTSWPRLVGAYGWVEHRIFQLTGAWASAPSEGADAAPGPELRVWCAAVSRHHGELAGRWAERLPVRAGVDPAALVVAPAGPLAGALDALAAEPDRRAAVAALVRDGPPPAGADLRGPPGVGRPGLRGTGHGRSWRGPSAS